MRQAKPEENREKSGRAPRIAGPTAGPAGEPTADPLHVAVAEWLGSWGRYEPQPAAIESVTRLYRKSHRGREAGGYPVGQSLLRRGGLTHDEARRYVKGADLFEAAAETANRLAFWPAVSGAHEADDDMTEYRPGPPDRSRVPDKIKEIRLTLHEQVDACSAWRGPGETAAIHFVRYLALEPEAIAAPPAYSRRTAFHLAVALARMSQLFQDLGQKADRPVQPGRKENMATARLLERAEQMGKSDDALADTIVRSFNLELREREPKRLFDLQCEDEVRERRLALLRGEEPSNSTDGEKRDAEKRDAEKLRLAIAALRRHFRNIRASQVRARPEK